MPDAAMPTNRCMSQAAMATRMRIVTRAATTSLAVVRRGSDCPSPSRRCRGAVSPSVPDGSARCRSIPCGLRPHGSITSPHKTGSRDDGCVRLVETVVCSDEPGGEHWWPRGCLAGAGDPQPEACSVVAMLLCCYVVMLLCCFHVGFALSLDHVKARSQERLRASVVGDEWLPQTISPAPSLPAEFHVNMDEPPRALFIDNVAMAATQRAAKRADPRALRCLRRVSGGCSAGPSVPFGDDGTAPASCDPISEPPGCRRYRRGLHGHTSVLHTAN